MFPGQIPESAFKPEVRLGKSGKRKAEDGLVPCAERAADSFCVRTGNPPRGSRSSWEPGEPTGDDSLNEVTSQQVSPREGHMAEEASSTTEAFWALLKQAGYTIW